MPPGRQTRTSSSAAAWWWGANITPIEEMTTSKLVVLEGQVLGVGLRPLQLDARGRGAGAPGLEQLRGQVAGDDRGAGFGGRDRGVAGPGGDVEDALASGPIPQASTSRGPSGSRKVSTIEG